MNCWIQYLKANSTTLVFQDSLVQKATVKFSYNRNHIQWTPPYSRQFLQERMKSWSKSHKKISTQQTIYSRHLFIVDTYFLTPNRHFLYKKVLNSGQINKILLGLNIFKSISLNYLSQGFMFFSGFLSIASNLFLSQLTPFSLEFLTHSHCHLSENTVKKRMR